MNAGASAGALQSAGATPPVLEGPSTDVPSPLNTVALVTHPLAVVSPGNLDINDKRGDTKLISSLVNNFFILIASAF